MNPGPAEPEADMLPSELVRLGLAKTFVKTHGRRTSKGFWYINETFCHVSADELQDVLAGPQIWELLQDHKFKEN